MDPAQWALLLTALGASGVVQWLVGGPARKRALRVAEHDSAMTSWEKLHDAQRLDLADLRLDLRVVRDEQARERIECANRIGALETDIKGMQTKVTGLEAALYRYETINTPIALKEAAKQGAEAFLAAVQDASMTWDGKTERRAEEGA